jgi:hypothetical protein
VTDEQIAALVQENRDLVRQRDHLRDRLNEMRAARAREQSVVDVARLLAEEIRRREIQEDEPAVGYEAALLEAVDGLFGAN